MKKVFIIYRSFFDMNGQNYTIGGIQTYIRQLIDLFRKVGLQIIIVQFADINFKKQINNDVVVYGIDVRKYKSVLKKSKVVLEFIREKYNPSDIIVFASEDLYVPIKFTQKVVAIQHGITWDKPLEGKYYSKFMTLSMLRRHISSYKRIKRIRNLRHLVCVDYNFMNWYRTQVDGIQHNTYVIPNFTKINYTQIYREDDKVRLIFARRFEPYRGTRLFAKVAKQLLNKYEELYITFAGIGSDERFLKDEFSGINRVNFITYDSKDSLKIHAAYHIAVIPTIGSEGTSLSLLEAMASKCAVVATNVGGMTNIILDNYNGLLVNPEEKELYTAIDKLIKNKEFREVISDNAYNTVSQAFNKELWERRWINVLEEVSK